MVLNEHKYYTVSHEINGVLMWNWPKIPELPEGWKWYYDELGYNGKILTGYSAEENDRLDEMVQHVENYMLDLKERGYIREYTVLQDEFVDYAARGQN